MTLFQTPQNPSKLLTESIRHWEAGRAIVAVNLSYKPDGSKQLKPMCKWKKLTEEQIFDESCQSIKDNKAANGLAILTGEFSKVTVIDLDCKNGQNGLEVFEAMCDKHSESMDNVVCAESKSGGLHYYFKYTPELKEGQKSCFKHEEYDKVDIDIRNQGGLILCSPTPGYVWKTSPFEYALTEVPKWVGDWYKESHKNEPTKIKLAKIEAPAKTTRRKLGVPFVYLRNVVESISSEYAYSYDDWLDILMKIHNISMLNLYPTHGLELAHLFSKKCPEKYDEAEVQLKWNSFTVIGELENSLLSFKALTKYIPRSYNKVKAEFEKTAFKVMDPQQFCIDKDTKISSYSHTGIQNAYQNKLHNKLTKNGVEPGHFIPAWQDDPTIRTYDSFCFDPPPFATTFGCYNLYTGLAASRLPPNNLNVHERIGMLQSTLRHLWLMSGKNHKCYRFQMRWLAQRVQCPGMRPKIGMVYKSVQGAGKGIWWENFGKNIIGDKYFYSTSGMRDLTGNFNEGLKHRILVFLDETKTKDSFRDSEDLKRCIDAPTLKVNIKFEPITTLRNCAGWVFASNSGVPVKIEASDRRYMVFECSPDMKGNGHYFSALARDLENPMVQREFYDYLMNMDLTNLNLEKERPETELYKDLKEASMPADVSFIQWLIDEDMLVDFNEEEGLCKMSGSDLHKSFSRFKEQYHINAEVLGGPLLGMAMKKWFQYQKTANKRYYSLDKKDVVRRLVEAGYDTFSE